MLDSLRVLSLAFLGGRQSSKKISHPRLVPRPLTRIQAPLEVVQSLRVVAPVRINIANIAQCRRNRRLLSNLLQYFQAGLKMHECLLIVPKLALKDPHVIEGQSSGLPGPAAFRCLPAPFKTFQSLPIFSLLAERDSQVVQR